MHFENIYKAIGVEVCSIEDLVFREFCHSSFESVPENVDALRLVWCEGVISAKPNYRAEVGRMVTGGS